MQRFYVTWANPKKPGVVLRSREALTLEEAQEYTCEGERIVALEAEGYAHPYRWVLGEVFGLPVLARA
jgi:hypothetical protein